MRKTPVSFLHMLSQAQGLKGRGGGHCKLRLTVFSSWSHLPGTSDVTQVSYSEACFYLYVKEEQTSVTQDWVDISLSPRLTLEAVTAQGGS